MCKKAGFIGALVLAIIVGGLAGYLCFDLTFDKDNNDEKDIVSEESISYTYKDIAGFYSFKEKNTSVTDQDFSLGYNLYLWEDGTFKYQYTMNTESSHLGNYTIVDDEIHLNYLFSGGSDAAINSITGNKVLKITDNNTLVDENGYFASQGGSQTITLKRSKKANNNYDDYKVENIINAYFESNNTSSSKK